MIAFLFVKVLEAVPTNFGDISIVINGRNTQASSMQKNFVDQEVTRTME
jgi:hypothetical protein